MSKSADEEVVMKRLSEEEMTERWVQVGAGASGTEREGEQSLEDDERKGIC